jgi:REP element-mobilizing transposase RayT
LKGIIEKAGYQKYLCTGVFSVLSIDKEAIFRGGKSWTQSYFVETIENANEDVFRSYVRDQFA